MRCDTVVMSHDVVQQLGSVPGQHPEYRGIQTQTVRPEIWSPSAGNPISRPLTPKQQTSEIIGKTRSVDTQNLMQKIRMTSVQRVRTQLPNLQESTPSPSLRTPPMCKTPEIQEGAYPPLNKMGEIDYDSDTSFGHLRMNSTWRTKQEIQKRRTMLVIGVA